MLCYDQPFKFTENERRRYLRNTLPLIDFLKQICNLEAKKRALLKLCGSRGVVVDVSFFEADLRAFVKSLEGLTTTLEAAGEKSHSRPEDCRAQQVLQELLGLHEDITSREGGSTLLLEIKESYDRDEKKRSRKACLYRRPASHRRSSFRLAKCRIARPGTAASEYCSVEPLNDPAQGTDIVENTPLQSRDCWNQRPRTKISSSMRPN